ncbi:CDP-glycerol glycerophosphotransferase [Hamadaea flava]|uniref:Glycosyltransferase family 2 protein n=1 Tax=Hamadaea flava TaxID=1742688 RepID=A0ABV8LKB6_9ACTN|nr:glycosyltransferase family 2 protein [Hamadaea flava]MCP2323876.1 CDP-glycerol glycerophosphotransferase [Hamadaea flava]
MTPRLSVVVPYYNVADYIAECLDSLRRQTFGDFEVILVDDGSLDATGLIAEDYCRTDPRFRLVVQENQGLGPARNTGVRYSEGEYLTFVDSDDLVPRHAFEVMVQSLDETGSSFAAAGARRFDDYGSWGSWLHGKIFAANRPATHVVEYYQAAIDRMVWNKVFRRSFWDEFGYEFPAIRYEDYPVTLKAYLDAVTVDIVAQPNYYWRERTTNDSITQRRAEFANLCDRIRSADLVLDLVEELPAYLRDTVHMHLAQVDMVTLVDAFGELSDEDCVRLARVAQRFAERIDKGPAARSSYLGRVQHQALRTGDIEMLRAVAEIRRDGTLNAVRAERSQMPWRRHELVPPNRGGQAKSLFRIPGRAPYAASTTVTDLDWETDAGGETDLVVRGTAEIRHLQIDATSKLRMVLEANGVEVPLPVERFPAYDSHGDRNLVGYSVRVPHSTLAGIPARNEPATLRATISQGHVKRTTVLRNVGPGNPSMPPGAWINGGSWLQPLPAADNRLLLRHITDPARLTSAALQDGCIFLEGALPPESDVLQLIRTWARTELTDCEVVPGDTEDRFTARVPVSELLPEDDPDDPVTGRTVWRLETATPGNPVLALGLTHAVSQVFDGRLVQISRAADNCVIVTDGPVRPIADEIGLAEDVGLVTVSGQSWAALDFPLVWRRVGDGTGDDDVTCSVGAVPGGLAEADAVAEADFADVGVRWTALTDVERLVAASPQPLHSSATIWQLVALPATGRPYAVQPDAFLAADASITLAVGEHQLTLRPHADRVTVEVR